MYDDGAFIDSNYIANLINEIELSTGEEKVGLLFKLLNGYYFSKPELAKDLSEKALKYALELPNDSLIAYAYHYYGLAYLYLDYFRISNDLYMKGLSTNFAQRTNNYRSWVLMNMGNNYSNLEEYDLAVENYYKALKLNEIVGSEAFAAKVYINLCSIFLLTGDLEESIKNYKLALEILDKEKDKRLISELFIIRSNVSFVKNENDSAQYYFIKAFENAEQLNDSLLITQILYEHGNKLYEEKLYFQALEIFKKGINYCNINSFNLRYYTFLHGIGKSNLFLGNTDIAEDLLIKAQQGMEKHSAKEKLQQLELSLSQLYVKLGDWENFNIHYNKSEEYRIAHLKENELHIINELKIVYNTEQKEDQIEYQEFQISAKEKQIWLISGIALVILIGLLGTIRFSKKLNETNKEIFKQNIELSRRWNQLQQFYKSNQIAENSNKSATIFSEIINLMNDEKIFKKTDLNVEFCAKRVSTNIKYISNAIKDGTGMNFNTFVNTYRIEEAKGLFLNSKSAFWTLEAIAEECGFNNLTSFYQAFKKNTGLTPSQFRNTISS